MDILFIGGVFTKDQQNEIIQKSKSVVQFAANVLQWNIIKGLDACNNQPISILNAIFVGSYPLLYKDLYIKPTKWGHTEGAKDENIGFLNIYGLKRAWIAFNLANKVVNWAKISTSNKKIIIVYSMNTPFIYAAAMAKKINPNIHLCLIVPDLPEFMNLSKQEDIIYKLTKRIDRLFMNKFLKYIDSFVLLTKYMANAINVKNRPWVVIEGMVDPDEIGNNKEDSNRLEHIRKREEKIILYTGALTKAYGIIKLLKAFTLISNPSYKLYICGEGEAKDEIIAVAANDNRIRYFGQVNRDSVLELQRKATILVNPRPSSEEFTKYSFPSKIMEYMVSGTLVLTTPLPGMPKEYYDYVYIFEDESVEGMAKTLDRILKLPPEELYAKGASAREFVLREKNNIVQAKKIIDMIERVLREN